MPRAILLGAALLGACLPAFAPGIRAAKHHAAVSPSASDTSCLGCHPTEREAEAHGSAHDGAPIVTTAPMVTTAPIVATWMVDDRRGCVGCHDVREPRR